MNRKSDGRSRDNRFYQRLWCSHIRMVDVTRVDLKYGETQLYCVRCDGLQTVVGPATRWGEDQITPIDES